MAEVVTGGPAFPHGVYDESKPAPCGDLGCWQYGYGMTLRDWFASHAPAEIPKWFEVEADPLPAKPDPQAFGFGGEHLRAAQQWMRDDAGADLISFMPSHDGLRMPKSMHWDPYPQSLIEQCRQFQAACRAWSQTVADQQRNHQVKKYFAWRWYYAQQMLAARAA